MTDIEKRIAARKIAVALHCDSRVPVDESEPKLLAAIELDGIPTDEEIELLVCPMDDEGERAAEKYPNIDAAIAEFF